MTGAAGGLKMQRQTELNPILETHGDERQSEVSEETESKRSTILVDGESTGRGAS